MNSVRITSGKYRGRVLNTPGGATHPMGERERLALFNMLGPYLEGAKVLDAYAGSGALGCEALSRGAKEVMFIEKNAKAGRVIRENLANLGIQATIWLGKVADFKSNDKFEIVIADPPYDDFRLSEVEKLVPLVEEGGVLVLSHPGQTPELAGMRLVKTRQYAAAHLSIYELA